MIKNFLKILAVQLTFVAVIIILITALRFFDNAKFEELKGIYSRYAEFDTGTSLVYEGQ